MSYRVYKHENHVGVEICHCTTDWLSKSDLLEVARRDAEGYGPGLFSVEQYSAAGNDEFEFEVDAE